MVENIIVSHERIYNWIYLIYKRTTIFRITLILCVCVCSCFGKLPNVDVFRIRCVNRVRISMQTSYRLFSTHIDCFPNKNRVSAICTFFSEQILFEWWTYSWSWSLWLWYCFPSIYVLFIRTSVFILAAGASFLWWCNVRCVVLYVCL